MNFEVITIQNLKHEKKSGMESDVSLLMLPIWGQKSHCICIYDWSILEDSFGIKLGYSIHYTQKKTLKDCYFLWIIRIDLAN